MYIMSLQIILENYSINITVWISIIKYLFFIWTNEFYLSKEISDKWFLSEHTQLKRNFESGNCPFLGVCNCSSTLTVWNSYHPNSAVMMVVICQYQRHMRYPFFASSDCSIRLFYCDVVANFSLEWKRKSSPIAKTICHWTQTHKNHRNNGLLGTDPFHL